MPVVGADALRQRLLGAADVEHGLVRKPEASEALAEPGCRRTVLLVELQLGPDGEQLVEYARVDRTVVHRLVDSVGPARERYRVDAGMPLRQPLTPPHRAGRRKPGSGEHRLHRG